MRFRPAVLFAALSSCFACTAAHATTDAGLQAIVGKRLHGDTSGACFAVAVIDKTVSRAYVCADGKDASDRIDAKTAFEIGSVSKPMMAALLAGLIRDGKASLDDPLSAYLPKGSSVPTFDGKPILLRHIVTHTSGLPAIPAGVDHDPLNPYAKADGATLLKVLSTTSLAQAPGAKFEYSNFAAMLLSYAIARRAGSDFETLLDTRVFAPLGMDRSYINRKPEGVTAAIGHTPDAKATPAWTFPSDFAGVGGVRSTLDDMVRYVQGQFGGAPKPLDADFRMTHVPVANDAKAPIAMHWMLAQLNGRTFLAHEGGTGGFSSFVAFDPERKFGVVILSDTALHERGGLGSLGLHLLDPKVPLGKPRTGGSTPPLVLSAEELNAYAGEYPLMPNFVLTVRVDGGTLTAQATGQGAFPIAPTAKDVFEAPDFGIVIRFQRDAAGKVVALKLDQGGHTLDGQRK
ncbi:MAG: serine hydrolase [Lysobacter sp.]|nr:serine hydrolase [Lysobacter sp.]